MGDRNAAARGDTAAQLQDDIDSGATRDKAAGFDPAAAPLGTDEEAAGTPPSATEIAAARQAERKASPDPHPNAANPQRTPDGAARPHRPPQTMMILLAAVALVLVAGWLFLA